MPDTKDLKQRARSLEIQGDDTGALELYSSLSQKDLDPGLLGRIGNLQLRLGDEAAATDAYERAAAGLIEEGFENAAIAIYNRLLRVKPDHPLALLRVGELAAEHGYRNDAVDAFDAAARLIGPGDAALQSKLFDRLEQLASGPTAPVVASLVPVLRERFPAAETEVDQLASTSAAVRPGTESVGVLPAFDVEPEQLPHVSEPPRPELHEIAPLEGLQAHGQEAADVTEAEAAADSLPLVEPSAVDDLPGLERSTWSLQSDVGAGSLDEVAEEAAGSAEGHEDEADELPLLGFTSDLPSEAEQVSEPEPEISAADVHDWVDLGSLVLSDDDLGNAFGEPSSEPRKQSAEQDFGQLLEQVGLEPIGPDDHTEEGSHYDLGLAFKEMGLLDKAIDHLRIALSTGANPLATLEVLGECLLESGAADRACMVLDRAANLEVGDELELIGVRYWLGRCHEAQGEPAAARDEYAHVVEIEPRFRDAAKRLERL